MYVVSTLKQQDAETMDHFYEHVKNEAYKMNFEEIQVGALLNLIILSQLVNSTHNSKLRRKAINDNFNLQQFRDYARAPELTELQMQDMKPLESSETNHVWKGIMWSFSKEVQFISIII